jgi:hypothetical protein
VVNAAGRATDHLPRIPSDLGLDHLGGHIQEFQIEKLHNNG